MAGGGNGNVLQLDCGDRLTIMWIYYSTIIELYLSATIKSKNRMLKDKLKISNTMRDLNRLTSIIMLTLNWLNNPINKDFQTGSWRQETTFNIRI